VESSRIPFHDAVFHARVGLRRSGSGSSLLPASVERVLQSLLTSRVARRSAYHALSAWQYLVGSNEPLYQLGLAAWKRLVTTLPVRPHLLVCDPQARSPLALPEDSRALVTTVAEAKLDHFDEVLAHGERLASAPDIPPVFEAMTNGNDRYHFRLPLNPRDVTDPRNDVFVKFALQPRIAGLVQRYFGVPCHLNEVRLLLSRPTPGHAPSGPQHWHRDPDDWMTVSVFVYLTDVDEGTAPFCYVPLQHSRSLYGRAGMFRQLARITPDHVMETVVPREHWVEVTGPKGTVVFLDSASCYHRGKQARSGQRLCLQLVFCSTWSRMDLIDEGFRLSRPEWERRHTYESPDYAIESSAPRPRASR
jgi:hypothetical protein